MKAVREISCLLRSLVVAALGAASLSMTTPIYAVPVARSTIVADDLRGATRVRVAPDSAPLLVAPTCASHCMTVKPIKAERTLVAGGDPPIVVDFCGRRAC